MPGISRRHFGWGLGVIAVAAIGFAIAKGGTAPVPPIEQGEKLIAQLDGEVVELVVAPGATVDAGLDLVMLDDAAAQEGLKVAQAELEKVLAETRASGVAIVLPDPPIGLGGRIVQTGPLHPETGVARAPKNVDPLPKVAGTGEASVEIEPKPNPAEVARIKKAAEQEIADAKADEAYLASEITNTKLELEEAQRAQETSRIITDRARLEVERGKRLLLEGAVSQNSQILRDNQLRAQEDILRKNQARVDEATSKLASLNEKLEQAQQRQSLAKADLTSAPEKATPKIGSVTKLPVSPPEQMPKMPTVRKPAFVIPHSPEASTAPAKVEINSEAKQETDERLQQAQNKLKIAEQAVFARRITAPKRIKIVKWLVKPTDRIKKGDEIAIIEYLPEAKGPDKAPPTPETPKPAEGVSWRYRAAFPAWSGVRRVSA